MQYPTLFSSIRLRGLELKNRSVFPAMGTHMPSRDGNVTQQLIDYHVARVVGGCALNMVEVSCVHAPSKAETYLTICSDKDIAGHERLVNAVHAAGGKAGVQLWQGGLVASSDPAAQVILPSDMPLPSGHTLPGATVETIQEVVRAYGQAARRAVAAGYDTMEYHAGHNYMPHTFLSPAFNRREDAYGGNPENRARFLLECIREIRANVPTDMPLFMRIDAHDDYLPVGLTIEDVIQFCKWAGAAGVDVVDVSRGNVVSAALKYEVPPIDIPRGFNVDNAARIKAETGLITMAVGRINTPELAEEVLTSGKADLIGLGRAQLADPDFVGKAANGGADIVHCVGCNQGCFDGFSDKTVPFITCLRNPALGREAAFASCVACSRPMQILVAGGGVAGMEAALRLKRKGHAPILCETSGALGGQFLLAGYAPRKQEMADAVREMARFLEKEGVDIRLCTQVTPELIHAIRPDRVVIAIGSSPTLLNVPGADGPQVSNSHDVLEGNVHPNGKVAVVGGGLVGLEVAELLSENYGLEVSVIEMLPQVAADLGKLRKITVMEQLQRHGVELITDAKCTTITPEGVCIEKGGEAHIVPADSVVIAIGARSRPSEALQQACESLAIPCDVIGDAKRARRALNAVAEAAEVALLA